MQIRNIAIIAHVDHGKTTLVDGMLKQTHTFRDNQLEMSQTTILDNNELEREKGITILAKNTAVNYKDFKINIIDTPGHADFGGEVERVINMADGALLVVDAAEGPLPQTTFVLKKAFERNLKVIVVINKIDRSDARPIEILREIEDLFLHLAKNDDQLHFPVVYTIGRSGKSWDSLPDNFDENKTLDALFETIINHIPNPISDPDKPFKMLISTLDFDSHKGIFAIGKISQGTAIPGQKVLIMNENEILGNGKIQEIYVNYGLGRKPTEKTENGDIVALTGLGDVSIGFTVTDPSEPTGLPAIYLEEPTLKIQLSPNTSPLSGKEGKFHTARQIMQRLEREKKINIGLKIEQNTDGNGFIVSGRGELHLAILIENLRREGYEVQVGKPEVITKIVDGVKKEPFEELTIEIDQSYVGIITEELGKRKAELIDTYTNERNIAKIKYKVSSKNLLGFRGEILTKTRGNGLFASQFIGYFDQLPEIPKLRNGVIISTENGKATTYSLQTVQERGRSIIGPGTQVYEGMIIGINNRSEDIDVNVVKAKKLTNNRSVGEDTIMLDQPLKLTIEQCLDFLEADELLEITPENLRLRKKYLTKLDRTRANRNN